MRVLFFGSSEYCLPVVEALNGNFQLVAIITKPDRKLGSRHPELDSGSIIRSRNKPACAGRCGMTSLIFTPSNKYELLELKNEINNLNPDLAIVADYGLIIPQEIYNIPKHKTLNIHFSKLPDLRGASPIQYTILRGDKTAWITVQLLDVCLDTGDIIWQKSTDLDGTETTDSLYKKLFNIAAVELPNIINKYVRNDPPAGGKPQKQDHMKATYSKILTRDDGSIPSDLLFSVILSPDTESGRRIPTVILKTQGILRLMPQDDTKNLSQLAIFIERSIRAFTPWPGVWTTIQITDNPPRRRAGRQQITTKRLKILNAHLEEIPAKPLQLHYASRHTNVAGKMHRSVRLVIDKVQLEGKNPVTWKQFLDGYPNIIW